MPDESKGKVRHCMGWAISREREKVRKEFRRHVNVEDPSLQALTKQDFQKKELIDALTWSSQNAQEVSKFPESLTVTESRQYKNSGLTIIRDVYIFALELEEMRMTLLNTMMLKNFKGELLENAKKELRNSDNLKSKWLFMYVY